LFVVGLAWCQHRNGVGRHRLQLEKNDKYSGSNPYDGFTRVNHHFFEIHWLLHKTNSKKKRPE
ncbi:MAG TPA: hypothetical protein PKK14_08615, partial [Pseudomonadales bacterium]|nr:hypothetical protein [Pseudomonadales bacterium]